MTTYGTEENSHLIDTQEEQLFDTEPQQNLTKSLVSNVLWLLLIVVVLLIVVASLSIPLALRAKCKLPTGKTETIPISVVASPITVQLINITSPGIIRVIPNIGADENDASSVNMDDYQLFAAAAQTSNTTSQFTYKVARSSVIRGAFADFTTTFKADEANTTIQIHTVDEKSRILSCKHVDSTLIIPVRDVSESLRLIITSVADKTAAPAVHISKGVVFEHIEVNSYNGPIEVVLRKADYQGAIIQLHTESGELQVTNNGNVDIQSQKKTEIDGVVVGLPTGQQQVIILRSTGGNIKITVE